MLKKYLAIILLLQSFTAAQIEPGRCSELDKYILELENKTSSQDKTRDISPEFAGEIDSLYKLISQPSKPDRPDSLLSGKVFISFIVDTSGSALCCNVEEGMNPDYDSTALNYFENLNLRFTAGKKFIDGKYIVAPFRMVMPILFPPLN